MQPNVPIFHIMSPQPVLWVSVEVTWTWLYKDIWWPRSWKSLANVFETEVVQMNCTALWRRHCKSFTRGCCFHGSIEEYNLSSFEGSSWLNVLLFPKWFVFVWLVILFFYQSINAILSFSICKNASIQPQFIRCASDLPVLGSVIYYTGTKSNISQGFLPVLKRMATIFFSSFILKKSRVTPLKYCLAQCVRKVLLPWHLLSIDHKECL